MRLDPKRGVCVLGYISIHAPTWGATSFAFQALSLSDYFNPRTHVGCDPGKDPERPRLRISIHAPTWGATLVMLVGDTPEAFQSTHPRGVRHNNTKSYEDTLQFQSTHPRGVRHNNTKSYEDTLQFQSTHPRGVRPSQACLRASDIVFQSTHPRGMRRFFT